MQPYSRIMAGGSGAGYEASFSAGSPSGGSPGRYTVRTAHVVIITSYIPDAAETCDRAKGLL